MKLEFTSTETALTQWLEHLNKTEHTEDFITFSEESVGQFDRGLTNFFGITSPCHIESHHIAIYYFIFLDVIGIGIMARNKVPNDLFSGLLECSDEEYTDFHFTIIRRFLAYCWAQELIAADFLKWSWAEDDLRKVADTAPKDY